MGTTGTTEPTTWPTTVGGTVTDGSVTWTDIGKVFVADPLGKAASLNATFGTSSVQRVNLYSTATPVNLCQWHDDLTFVRPEEIKSATPPPAGSRPQATAVGDYAGNFSWLLTASPSTLQPGLYNVAVVVCSQRNIANEQTCSVTDLSGGSPTISNGGGALKLTPSSGTVNVRENTWIMLCNAAGTQAGWYRVVNAGPAGSTSSGQTLSVVGPDWTGATTDVAVIIDTVTGVYSTTVQLN